METLNKKTRLLRKARIYRFYARIPCHVNAEGSSGVLSPTRMSRSQSRRGLLNHER